MSRSKTSKAQIARLERAAEVLRLRKRGESYHAIAKTLGISSGTAHKDVKRAIRDLLVARDDEADELLALQLHRLDELLRATWAALEGGDLTAVDRALRVIQETNKLLGLYTERVGVLGAGELRVVFEE